MWVVAAVEVVAIREEEVFEEDPITEAQLEVVEEVRFATDEEVSEVDRLTPGLNLETSTAVGNMTCTMDRMAPRKQQ